MWDSDSWLRIDRWHLSSWFLLLHPYYSSTHLLDLNTKPDGLMSLTHLTHNNLSVSHSAYIHHMCAKTFPTLHAQKSGKQPRKYHLWEFSSEWISFWQLVLSENNGDIISGLFLLTVGCIMSFIMKKMTVFMRLSDWGLSLFPLILFTI